MKSSLFYIELHLPKLTLGSLKHEVFVRSCQRGSFDRYWMHFMRKLLNLHAYVILMTF